MRHSFGSVLTRESIHRCVFFFLQTSKPETCEIVLNQLQSLQEVEEARNWKVFCPNCTEKSDGKIVSLQEVKFLPLKKNRASSLHAGLIELNKVIGFSKRITDLVWVCDEVHQTPNSVKTEDTDAKDQCYEIYVALKRFIQAEKATIHFLAADEGSAECLNEWCKVLRVPTRSKHLTKVKHLDLNPNLCWRGCLSVHKNHNLSFNPHHQTSTPNLTSAVQNVSFLSKNQDFIFLKSLSFRRLSKNSESDSSLWQYPEAFLLGTFQRIQIPHYLLGSDVFEVKAPENTPDASFLNILISQSTKCFIIGLRNEKEELILTPTKTTTKNRLRRSDVSKSEDDWITYLHQMDMREIPGPKKFCANPGREIHFVLFSKNSGIRALRFKGPLPCRDILEIVHTLPSPFIFNPVVTITSAIKKTGDSSDVLEENDEHKDNDRFTKPNNTMPREDNEDSKNNSDQSESDPDYEPPEKLSSPIQHARETPRLRKLKTNKLSRIKIELKINEQQKTSRTPSRKRKLENAEAAPAKRKKVECALTNFAKISCLTTTTDIKKSWSTNFANSIDFQPFHKRIGENLEQFEEKLSRIKNGSFEDYWRHLRNRFQKERTKQRSTILKFTKLLPKPIPAFESRVLKVVGPSSLKHHQIGSLQRRKQSLMKPVMKRKSSLVADTSNQQTLNAYLQRTILAETPEIQLYLEKSNIEADVCSISSWRSLVNKARKQENTNAMTKQMAACKDHVDRQAIYEQYIGRSRNYLLEASKHKIILPNQLDDKANMKKEFENKFNGLVKHQIDQLAKKENDEKLTERERERKITFILNQTQRALFEEQDLQSLIKMAWLDLIGKVETQYKKWAYIYEPSTKP